MNLIWHALAALARAHGRRISWRDLASRAAHVPEARLTEVAVVALGEAGITAVALSGGAALRSSPDHLLPAVARLRGGDWIQVEKIDQDAVVVRPLATDGTPGTAERRPVSLLEGNAIELAFAVCAPVVAGHSAESEKATGPHDWFWRVFQQLRGYYGDCALAAVLINLLALAGSMFSMNVYDRIIPNAAMQSLWTLAIGVLIAAAVEFGMRTFRARMLDEAGKKADLALSSLLMRKTMNLRLEDRPASSGQWISQLREFESVRDFVSSTTLVALTDLPFALLFFGIIGWIAGSLVWVPVAGAVLVVILGVMAQVPIRRSTEQYQYESAHKHSLLIEIVERLETIAALGAQPVMQGRWERVSASTARSSMATRQAGAFAANASQLVQQWMGALLIVAGVYAVLAGSMTTGALIGASILAGRAVAPLGQVAGLLVRWHQTRLSFHAVDKIMQLPDCHDPAATYISWPQARPNFALEDVRFCYPRSEQPAIRIPALTLNSGEIIALTGPVGSGKSTLLRVLAGLADVSEGRLLVNGLDCRQVSPADWRAHVTWVNQDTVLFRGSLRENLLLGAPHVSDERLVQILQLTGLDRLAAAHPMGLDMPLGEGGQALSGGQRQWVALARGLLTDSPILLLDEPTSAMDMVGERELLNRLKPLLADRLVVIATHRPGPIEIATRMIVMDGGQVVADGSRNDVLASLQSGHVRRAPTTERTA